VISVSADSMGLSARKSGRERTCVKEVDSRQSKVERERRKDAKCSERLGE